MKKLHLFYIVPVICFFFTGCSKPLIKFNLNYSESTTIPASQGLNVPFEIATPDINSDIANQTSQNNTNTNLIEDIKLTELKATITNPGGASFSFMQWAEIYIDNDNLDPVLIASTGTIPDDAGSELVFNVENVDLKPYLITPTYRLIIKAVKDQPNVQDYEVKMDAKFQVRANVFGL